MSKHFQTGRHAKMLFVWFLLLLTGCELSKSSLMNQKFDAPLRQKISVLDNNNRTEILSIFGKCIGAIDEPMRQQIANLVVELQSVTDDIFAVRVSSDKIFDLAKLEFVVQLQLSQESRPLHN